MKNKDAENVLRETLRAAGEHFGRIGGFTRARRLSPARRRQIALKAVRAREKKRAMNKEK